VAEVVVLLRGDGTETDRRRTVEALKGTTADLNVFVGGSDAPRAELEAAFQCEVVVVVGVESEGGAVTDRHAWDVVRLAPGADVVLIEVGSTVGAGWRELLREAAYADAVVATSSAVPASMLNMQEPSSALDRPASGLSEQGPALGEPLWSCVYIRREALDVACRARSRTDDRADRSPPRLEELILLPGLVHVLAPAVVLPALPTPKNAGSPLTPAVRRMLAQIEASVEALRVTVDLRCCASPLSGTQVHALNLVGSLAACDELRLSVLVPARAHDSARPYLDALPSSVSRHPAGRPTVPSPHVFHRPYQLLTEDEITDVVTAGTRLVVTHQDMILDRTPAYFDSTERWRHYAATTALTFVAADEVVFFSEHAREEAVRDGLVDRAKTSVVPPGTNHFREVGEEVVPAAVREHLRRDAPFLFVIGNAYFHKNRLFALRLTDALRTAHGWDGAIVFGGGKPDAGSSTDEEEAFLVDRKELRANVIDLPRVTDAERRWLYRHAALVLFPTLYEGFGLVPFESAAEGTPCLYSNRSSVAEFLPKEGALLDLGDVDESARRLHDVLSSEDAGETIVEAIRRVGSELTWSRAADSYLDVYRRAMTRPVGVPLVLGREVTVGASEQMVSSETERRALKVLRRSGAVRRLADGVFAIAASARRAAHRRSRH
jgi:glycosyltransferase involved in cell wall biosynthesis